MVIARQSYNHIASPGLTHKKNFPLFNEKVKLQFRWEIYNLFNHTQFNEVNTTAQFDVNGRQISEGFGRVTRARSPRVMQGSLRLTF